MNQVTELLRLVPGASIDDAVTRLRTLFDLMNSSEGFRDAELLRKVDEPDLMLVLHTWDDIADWTAFRSADTKMAFSATRPDFLYTFVPCGIDWLDKEGEHSQEGGFVHRELIREALKPSSGPEVVCSQTFSYQDYEPSLEGVSLRLTRLLSAPTTPPRTGDDVLADEMYESVMKFAPQAADSEASEHAEVIG
jgi:heme-degrading monooxygenase HmoA